MYVVININNLSYNINTKFDKYSQPLKVKLNTF